MIGGTKWIRACLVVFSVVVTLGGCRGGRPAPEYEAFRDLARGATCAGLRNDLYAIDGHMVFWAREDDCIDIGNAYTLFGNSPDDVLCNRSNTFGGPYEYCLDERYHYMFDTILANLDRPDLGLSLDHTVWRLDF